MRTPSISNHKNPSNMNSTSNEQLAREYAAKYPNTLAHATVDYMDEADEVRAEHYGLQKGQVWGKNVKHLRKVIWHHLASGRHHEFNNGEFGDFNYFDLFPKTYNIPAGNYDPTTIGVAKWEMSFADPDPPKDSLAGLSLDTWKDIYGELKAFDWRTYFLDETCAEMINRSQLNEDMDMSEVRFTIPACVVSLPKSLNLSGDKDDPIMAVAISRTWTICYESEDRKHAAVGSEMLEYLGVEKADLVKLNKRMIEAGEDSWKSVRDSWTAEFNLDRINNLPADWATEFGGTSGTHERKIVLAPVLCIGGVTLKGNNIPIRFPMLDKSIKASLDFMFKMSLQNHLIKEGEKHIVEKQNEYAAKGTKEAILLTSFAIKLLLFMLAKPEEVDTNSKLIKKARERRGKLMNDNKWSACFIGRKYGTSMKIQGYGDDTKKIRAHWRQGHFRGVWKGKGRTIYAVVWVDPCYVNDPSKEESSC